jgi:hypothetical protein
MNVVETQWWIIDLPPEWDAEQDGETILIADETGVGEIAITTMQKEDGLVDDNELKQFIFELEAEYGRGEPVSVSEAEGYYFSYQEQGEAIREWFLRCDDLLLFVTYCCDASNAGMDDGAVDEILETLFIKPEEERGQGDS